MRRERINPDTVNGRGMATKILGEVFRNRPLLSASDGQKRIMRQRGYVGWETATADDARRFFAGMRKVKA